MSLFGSLMGDFDDDLFMGNHLNSMNMQMRSMNRLMNSLMPDPFNMLTPFDGGFQNNAMMERHGGYAGHGGPMAGLFGFPAMPNMNRLLSADIGSPNGASYCSSSVISMSSGPDGRPQIYQATSSTKSGPGGVRETRKTIQDSVAGVKKMAIGHHIGDRAHIIEKEQDLRSGQLEENQEFINLEEEEADQFDREFTSKARMFAKPQEMLSIEPADDGGQRHRYALPSTHHRQLPAITAPPAAIQQQQQNNSVHPHPYNTAAARRNHRSKHSKQHHQHQQRTANTTQHKTKTIKKDSEDN